MRASGARTSARNNQKASATATGPQSRPAPLPRRWLVGTAFAAAAALVGSALVMTPAQAAVDDFGSFPEGIEGGQLVSDVAGNGLFVVQRRQRDTGTYSTTFRYRRAAGRWSAPYSLIDGNHPWSVAAGKAGSGLAVWGSSTGTRVRLRQSTGAWSAPTRIATGATELAVGNSAAVNADGDMAVTWFRRVSGASPNLYLSVKLSGGTWRTSLVGPVQSETVTDHIANDVVIDAAGNATVARIYGPTGQVVVKTRRAAGTWSAPVAISPTGMPVRAFDVRTDPQGRLTAMVSNEGCDDSSPPECGFKRQVLVHQDQPAGAFRTLLDSTVEEHRGFAVASGGRVQLGAREARADGGLFVTQQLAPSVGPKLSVPDNCPDSRSQVVIDANGLGWGVNCDRMVRITPTALSEQTMSFPNDPTPVWITQDPVWGPSGSVLAFMRADLMPQGVVKVSP